MTSFALSNHPFPGDDYNKIHVLPTVLPKWFRTRATAVIVFLHACFFLAFIYAPQPDAISLDSVEMELVQDGDFIDAEEVAEAQDKPPPVVVENPEFALPPPEVMDPDALTLKAKQEIPEKEKIKKEREQAEQAQRSQEAQARRRAGAHGGSGSGASRAVCLAHIATDLRRHTPGTTHLGSGNAHVTFHVNAGGSISGISVSASSPGHAALARRIVASSRGPGNCGVAFVAQTFAFH
jgi:protein TonB